MNNILKYGLTAMGGLTLFTGAYVGVAALSGAPMYQVAGVGMFFDEPEDTGEGQQAMVSDSRSQDAATRGHDALERQAGLLGAFMVESPFTGTELRKLQDELKTKFQENRELLDHLRGRELELDEWEKTLQEKYNELADMRTKLEELESSLALRFAELERDEAAKKSRELAGWKAQAELYKGGEPETNAKMLEGESPEDAAILLRELGPEQAGEILRLVQPLSLRKEFTDAYRKVNETP